MLKVRRFDSSTGFRLPSGAVRSPDISWVSKVKLETLTYEQMEKYPPLCPEFVLELRSPTDRLEVVKEKMQEYMENGAELGWLIDPIEEKVYIYTSGTVEELEQSSRGQRDRRVRGVCARAERALVRLCCSNARGSCE